MNRLRRLAPRTRAGRGVAAIMGGTVAGQLLAVLASPILSRLYSPADFGTFSIVSALAITLGSVTTLRYEQAVPLPDEEDDARSLVMLGAGASLLWAVVLCATSPLWTEPLTGLFDDPNLADWLIAVPVIAAVLGLFRVLNQWALRHGRYAVTARRNALQSVATVVIQVLAGWRGAGAGGLIGGFGAGQAIGAVSMLPRSGLLRRLPAGAARRVAGRYRRFALVLAPSAFLNTAGIYVPLLLVAVLYGPLAAGWLGFTQRILSVPVMLVGQAVAQVYLSELARSRREATGRELAYFRIATKRLALVALPGTLLLLVAGPVLFSWVFGEQWEVSGELAAALAISLGAQLVASPLSQTLVVFERVGTQLVWDVLRLVATCAAVLGAHVGGISLVGAAWILGAASALAYVLSWCLSRQVLLKQRVPSPRAVLD